MDQLRALVFAQPALQAQLQAAVDVQAFVAEAMQIAHAHDIGLSESAIHDALRQGHRSWLERWL
jgi:hypothetical protein